MVRAYFYISCSCKHIHQIHKITVEKSVCVCECGTCNDQTQEKEEGVNTWKLFKIMLDKLLVVAGEGTGTQWSGKSFVCDTDVYVIMKWENPL